MSSGVTDHETGSPASSLPERLRLYAELVQNVVWEVELLEQIEQQHLRRAVAVFREDFAGGAALADAWARSRPATQVLAVERDPATAAWAAAATAGLSNLTVVTADVIDLSRHSTPEADLVHAGNFSVCGFHEPADVEAYFRSVGRTLKPGGVWVGSMYGGPDAWSVGRRTRASAFGRVVWEQRWVDRAARRTRCGLHLEADGVRYVDAFTYDWRLWTPKELAKIAERAGLVRVGLMIATDDAPGLRECLDAPDARDWQGYLILTRR